MSEYADVTKFLRICPLCYDAFMLSRNMRNFIAPPRPRSFAGLMEIYESNYIQLRRLCPDLHALRDEAVSRVAGAMDLHLRLIERSRYTTTVLLTYAFEDADGDERLNPNLIVRIYHDALQAEVLSRSCRLEGEVGVDHLPPEGALKCKWRLNRFLFKWLTYCHRQGHCFTIQAHEESLASSQDVQLTT